MALTIFLIFTICWLFWQNTKLYRTNTMLRDEIYKRSEIIEDLLKDMGKQTNQFNELTKKFNRLAQNHNDYVKSKKTDDDDGENIFTIHDN